MTQSIGSVQNPQQPEQIRVSFLAVLPHIEQVARACFRSVYCGDRRQECISETVALCWLWHRRLEGAGRDSSPFITAMTYFAARAVKSGRRLCGQESAGDVLSRLCQSRRGFRVREFQDDTVPQSDVLNEALRGNTRTPTYDQAEFRIDFSDWRSTLDSRHQRIVDSMMEARSTSEIARQFGVSPGRVSQLRREFHAAYSAFCGE
jgi:DNA-directed RNA polymerase specialized sigma24 family protein